MATKTADERAIERLTMDYPVTLLTLPTSGRIIKGGLRSVKASVADDDELVAALLEALAQFDEPELIAAKFNPAELRDPDGKWTRSIGGRIQKLLHEWARGNGDNNDDPFVVDGKPIDRKPLRDVAKARGITLRRGAERPEIVKALLDDIRADIKGEKADKPKLPGAPADHRRFTIQLGAEAPRTPSGPALTGDAAEGAPPVRVVVDASAGVETHKWRVAVIQGGSVSGAAPALTRYLRDPAFMNKQLRGESPHMVSMREQLEKHGLGPTPEKAAKDAALADRHIAAVDKLMAQSPLPNDVVVWRGADASDVKVPDDAVGFEWTDPGYVSTAVRREYAQNDFASGNSRTLQRILAPQGTPALSLHGGEGELLLGRGQRFRVVADHGRPTSGARHLDVEIVPTGRSKPSGVATDVGIFGNPTTGKLSLYRESDTGKKTGRAIKSFDDMGQLETWARDNGHTELADYARSEAGKHEAPGAPNAPSNGAIPTYSPPASLTAAEQQRAAQLVRRDPQIFAKVHDRFGPISTSGNLSNGDAAWLQSVFEREPAFVNHLAQTEQINRRLRADAKKAGETPAAYKAKVAARLKEVIADKPVAVRVTDEGLRGILAGGRFKTSFDTGAKRAPGLHVDVNHRRLGEEVNGIAPDTPPEKRPVYGYVAINGIEPALFEGKQIPLVRQREGQEDVLSAYGKVQVVLKPDVRPRTSVTVGDSLDELGFMRPSPIDNPSAESVGFGDHERLAKPGFTRTGYVEAQIHGGLSSSDIAEVVFPSEPSTGTATQLRDRGISWRVLRPGDKPIPPADYAKAEHAKTSPPAKVAKAAPAKRVAEKATGFDARVKQARKGNAAPAARVPSVSAKPLTGDHALAAPPHNLAALTAAGDLRADALWYRTGDNSLETASGLPGAFEMSQELRGQRAKTPENRQRIKDIDSVMKDSVLTAPIEVYRGIGGSRLPEPGRRVGKTFTDKAFASATTDQKHGAEFGGTIMRIRVPAGVSAIRMADRPGSRYENESEVLLDRGLRYRVVAEYPRGRIPGFGGAHVMDVEIVQ